MKKQTKNITTKYKSIIKKLQDQDKINDHMLVCLNTLSLEELIAVKYELSCRSLNNRLYGFDIWRGLPNLVKSATLKFAISATHSKKDAARFLGLTYLEFSSIYKKYEIDNFFNRDTQENT